MVKRKLKYLLFFSVLLIHVGFLAAIFHENQSIYELGGFILLVLCLLFLTYKFTPLWPKSRYINQVTVVAFVFLGATCTYFLHHSLALNTVLAAAIVGLLGSFIRQKREPLKQINEAIYCGAFVGMTQLNISVDYIFITASSFIAGIFLIGLRNAFIGIGGKLGLLAFGGVTISFLSMFILSQWM